MPLRTLLAALLLAGLGLWQAWQCTDGMMASPMATTTMSVTITHTDHPALETVSAAEPDNDTGMPGAMAGLCITVLASLAAAIWLMRSPLRLRALLQRMILLLILPRPLGARRGPALAQLCVSRT